MAPILVFSTVDVNSAQVILEAVIIICISIQPVQSSYMRRFVNSLVEALIVETLLMASYAYALDSILETHIALIAWKVYKLVHLFVSLSLCYPIMVFLNQKIKFHLIFLFLASIIAGGGIVDFMRSERETPSGFNDFAFMLIFIFTFQQYRKLKHHLNTEGGNEVKGLNVLMAIEMALIFLNFLLIILFIGGSTHFLQPLRLSIILVQYFRIYLIVSLFASLNLVT